MVSRKCCESGCDDHAVQRSLYRHALNALQLASRSGCASQEALDLNWLQPISVPVQLTNDCDSLCALVPFVHHHH